MELLVILDNGHGGLVNGVYVTPGKRSPVWADGTQLFEGVYNRLVVDRIAAGLETLGIDYSILVKENADISLIERVKRANEIYKANKDKKVILCSVHGNAAVSPEAKGFEVFTTKGETQSDKIANIFMQNCILYFGKETKMRTDNKDGDLDKEENFYIIHKTLCPAFLSENGFFTNYEECKKMMTPEWQQTVADVHIRTFEEYAKLIKDL